MMTWDDSKLDDLFDLAAARLRAAAVFLQVEHMKRINESAQPYTVKRTRGTGQYTAYARPSRPGEYLRKRTGFHQGSLIYQPTDLASIVATGRIRVGYGASDVYGPFWEKFASQAKRRKGLLETMDSIKGQLGAIIAG